MVGIWPKNWSNGGDKSDDVASWGGSKIDEK